MRKIIAIWMVMAMALCFAACGQTEETAQEEEDQTAEIALIIDGDIEDGGFNQVTWESIESFCTEHELTCAYYKSSGDTDEAIDKTVKEIIEKKGKLLIFAGSDFETAVYRLQKEHEDLYFYLIDGVPHDKKDKYEYGVADNSIGVLFAEEQAGYLAGYAAVMDGYKSFGFLGGEELPSVKRYGYGFLQGISAAATEKGMKDEIDVRYQYAGTFEATPEVQKVAEEWYADGTEVIFSCGGAIIKSVIKAAEAKGGKIIGVDTDQSGLSETIITSAKKRIDEALDDVLKEYNRGNFVGNNVFNYTANNKGVGLEMTNARFNSFDQSQYKEIFNQIKEGSVQIDKDAEEEDMEDELNNIHLIR